MASFSVKELILTWLEFIHPKRFEVMQRAHEFENRLLVEIFRLFINQ